MPHTTRRSTSSFTRSAVIVATIIISAASLVAQDRIVAMDGSTMIVADGAPDNFGVVQRKVELSPPVQRETAPVSIPGGRFFAVATTDWSAGDTPAGLAVIDSRTGTVSPVPDFARVRITRLIADAWRPRLFVFTQKKVEGAPFGLGQGLSLVDLTTLRTTELMSLSFPETAVPLAYAPAADLLFVAVWHTDSPERRELVALHVGSGSITNVTTLESEVLGFSTTADGTRAFALLSSPSLSLVKIDVPTGSTVARLDLPNLFDATVLVDEPRRRLIVDGEIPRPSGLPWSPLTELGAPRIAGALDFDLNLLGTVVFDWNIARYGTPLRSGQFAVSPKSASVFGVVRTYYGYDPTRTELTFIDGATGVVGPTVDVQSSWRSSASWEFFRDASFFVQSPPARPALSANTVARSVDLSWSHPGDTSHFDIEIGTAPGLRNLLVLSTASNSFAASAVPPGTYYVRVRAINEIGRSFPSNEIRIVVP